jgi:gas vesicle structural protein
MTAGIQPAAAGGNGGSSGDLADVIETILDKGLVIDAHIAIGVVGIRLVTIDARVVVAGVDTYLRFAEAVNRLDLSDNEGKELPDMMHPGNGMVEKAGEKLGELVGGGSRDRQPSRRRREREED